MVGLLIFSAYYKNRKKTQTIWHHRKRASIFISCRIKKDLKNSFRYNILWGSASKSLSLWRKLFQINVQNPFASFSKSFVNCYFYITLLHHKSQIYNVKLHWSTVKRFFDEPIYIQVTATTASTKNTPQGYPYRESL